MTDFDAEDSLTKLNTQLNKSMVLMDNTMEYETCQPKSVKTIKINTKIQPASPSNASPVTSRRSILKKTDKTPNGRRSSTDAQDVDGDKERLNNVEQHRLSMEISAIPRPHTLEDLIAEEGLVVEPTKAAFNFEDISDSEDMWVMEIPRTIDPEELRGQTLVLGEKSKFKIKEERYCAVSHDVKCNVTCVFNSGKVKSRYKTVNVKPAGVITVRRKLSGIPKIKPIQVETSGVPFPKNLKIRHPLFGVNYEGKARKGAIKQSI